MTDPGLFSDESVSIRGGSSLQRRSEAECAHRQSQVRRSALWAAYGDALGWISELVGRRGLSRRTSGKPLRRPIEWKRRIGGRAGITASLPRGCYSDDSQLRLATGRAIRASGFDVEAFAKVELPVWLSYGLGGGRATGVAAANLARANVPWFANTFKGWANSEETVRQCAFSRTSGLRPRRAVPKDFCPTSYATPFAPTHTRGD